MFSLDPCNKDFLNTLEFLLKFIGGSGGFILFIIGFKRYKKAQTWKRSEFVAKEIREFTSDKMVKNVMYILDWGTRKIELFPDKEKYEDRYVKIDREIVKLALQYHRLRIKTDASEIRFTEIEVAIRDHFDQFLSYFERFEQFIKAKLITKEELEPYIEYWINTISNGLEVNTRDALFIFITEYEFNNTQKLFERFGKNVKLRATNIVTSEESESH